MMNVAAAPGFRVQSFVPGAGGGPAPAHTPAHGTVSAMYGSAAPAPGGYPAAQQQGYYAHAPSPPVSPRAGGVYHQPPYAGHPQQHPPMFAHPHPHPQQQLTFPPSPTTPRTPATGQGMYVGSPGRGAVAPHAQTPSTNASNTSNAKVVTVVSAETGEAQNFRLCAGEHGDNVRAAIRGAFGISESTPMALRDQSGVNVVLGYPSVTEGGRYELVVRSSVAPAQQAQPQPQSQPSPAPTLHQVHNMPSGASSEGPPAAPVSTHSVKYQESVTTRPPTADPTGSALTTGPKNRRHSQANPIPGGTKALLIGASYVGQKEALPASLESVKAVRAWLSEAGFHGQHLVLTDENPSDAAHLPTRENILRALSWLVQGAKSGDSLFLHFAGHGVEVRHDSDGSYDEALLPVDFRASRPFQVVRQTEVQTNLVEKLPYGCKLTIVCDCAHSGGMLELPFALRCKKDGNLEWREKLGFPESDSQGEVVMVSGWRGDQTTDSSVNALSEAFLSAMGKDSNATYEALVLSLKSFLYQKTGPGYQVPRISSNRRFTGNDRFYIATD